MLTTISRGEQLSALHMVFTSKGMLNGTATSYPEELSARAHNDPGDSDSCHHDDQDLGSYSEWAGYSDLDDDNMDIDMDDLDDSLDDNLDDDDGMDDELDDMSTNIGDPDNVDSMDIDNVDAQDIDTTNQSGNRMEGDDLGHMADEGSPIDRLAEVSCLSSVKLAARHCESICFSQVLT